ncbi:unnamed protein product [Closterium sp. NIES-53]
MAAAAKSSRRGGGGSGEDFSAWLGGAGYSEGDVRDIVADTLHGSRSDPTCENWEEVEQLCDHLDRWSPEERITMLDIVVAASADDDSGSELEGGKDDVVYVVSGTATGSAAAAAAVSKALGGADAFAACGDGEREEKTPLPAAVSPGSPEAGDSSRSSTSSTGSSGSSSSSSSSTRPSSAGSFGNAASRSTSTSSSGSSSGGSGPLRSINRNEGGPERIMASSGSALKATTAAGWGTHITRTFSTPDSRTTPALHAPASPDLLARAGSSGGTSAAGGGAASAASAEAGASKLSFSGPLQLARKLTGLGGRGRSGSPVPYSAESNGSPNGNGSANGSSSGRNSGLSGRSSSPTPLSPSPLTSRRRLALGASGASASRTGTPLRVTLCRAASSNPGELNSVSTAAERLIVAMGSYTTSSTSLPASSVSSPVGSGTFPSPNLFSAGLGDKGAKVRVDFRSVRGEEDRIAEGERSGAAAAAGDVGAAVSYLDSVGATVTGVELVLDESGEECAGLYLSCQLASVLPDNAAGAGVGKTGQASRFQSSCNASAGVLVESQPKGGARQCEIAG